MKYKQTLYDANVINRVDTVNYEGMIIFACFQYVIPYNSGVEFMSNERAAVMVFIHYTFSLGIKMCTNNFLFRE